MLAIIPLIALGVVSVFAGVIPASNTRNNTSNNTDTCPYGHVREGNEFQYPLLIVPVSAEDPDHAFGTQFEAYINSVNTTIFNFNIPDDDSYAGKTCNLVFLFPYGSELAQQPVSAPYDFSGTEQEVGSNGGLNFALLDGIADQGTTFNNKPAIIEQSGTIQVIPGNEYPIGNWPCEGGTYTFSISSVNGVRLNYFQNYGYKPIGLYIVPC